MDAPGDPFFSVENDHLVIAIFQLAEVKHIEVLVTGSVFRKEDVVISNDADAHRAALWVEDRNTEFQAFFILLLDV